MATARGYEDRTWQRLAAELGLPGLAIAEEYVLVVARDETGGLGVFAVDNGTAGLEAEQLVTLDQTRKQARLALSNVRAQRIGATDATAAIDKATAVSRALLAAEQAGGAQHCVNMTVEYARARIQFGRAIGSFQAIKQRLAEMLILTESAKSAAYITAQTVQLNGGIGFTWEHDAHLYFKRARASAILLGTASELTDLIGRQLEAII
jgi:alkylation response protein AidB-like acyl-CoA dehydrogenase